MKHFKSDSLSASEASAEAPTAAIPKQHQVVPWNPWIAVGFVIAVFFLSQVFAAVVVSLLAKGQAKGWLDTSIYAQFIYVVIAESLVVLALYRFLRLYKRGWSAIGFRRPKWSDLGYGLALVPLYYLSYILIVFVAGRLVPSLNVDQQQQLGFNPVGSWQLTLTFLSLVILPPLVEETLMRGYLYTSLKKGLPQLAAALATSVVFAAAHLQAGSGAPLLWVAAIDTFVLSLFLIWLREKTGSLWASMTLHALKNTVAFVSLFIFHLN